MNICLRLLIQYLGIQPHCINICLRLLIQYLGIQPHCINICLRLLIQYLGIQPHCINICLRLLNQYLGIHASTLYKPLPKITNICRSSQLHWYDQGMLQTSQLQSRRNPTRKRTVSMFWLHAPAHARASSASPRMYF